MCPDDGPRQPGWRASLELAFERRGDRTVLANRRHEGPLVVQKTLHPEGDPACHAIVVHPPAGVAGGDELRLSIAARDGAHALLTTPGAAKWYRSAGPWASQHTRVHAGDGTCVEWLPQETILYDASLARIAWEADLAPDARMIAWDIFCLGRLASGERFERGRARIETRVRRAGKLLWAERVRLEPAGLVRASAAGLASARVFGTLLAVAPAMERECRDAARAQRPVRGEGAITCMDGLLVARYRGDSTEAARAYFTAVWRRLREPVIGAAPTEPRIWRT